MHLRRKAKYSLQRIITTQLSGIKKIGKKCSLKLSFDTLSSDIFARKKNSFERAFC